MPHIGSIHPGVFRMIGIESQGKHYRPEETFAKHTLSSPAYLGGTLRSSRMAGLEIFNPAESGKHFSKVTREFNVAGDVYGI